MRIGINTLAVNREDFGGGERYLYFLLRHLAKIDQKNEYFIFVSSQNRDKFSIVQKNFRSIVCTVNTNSRIKRILYEQSSLPKLIKHYRIDVFHSPNNILPLRVPCKSVVTIQFMINFVFPNYFNPIYKRWYFNTLMKFTVRRANKIISVSYSLKKEIMKFLKIPGENIVTIPHGVDESFFRVYDKDVLFRSNRKWGIENPYLLCVANNVPNKNLEGLIYAFNYLKRKYKIPHQLVLVGSLDLLKGEKERLLTILKKAKNLNAKAVIFTGYVDYSDLPLLYSGADVFILPSFCESFGIPLLEAMKCGVPIVTSNAFAMPEVLGGAGLLVNPNDFKEIGEAIYTLLTNHGLKDELVRKGLERVKKFTWEKAARETLTVYEEVYRSRRNCLIGAKD